MPSGHTIKIRLAAFALLAAMASAAPARADVTLPGAACTGSANFNSNNGILTCNGSTYAANPTFIGTSASAPYTCSGTTYLGMIYYDTTAGALKNCTSSGWTIVGGVNSFSTGTTGLTPATATTGAITLAGTLAVANGGTGLTTLTSNVIYKGNGTGNLATSGLTDSGTLISSSENVDVTNNAVLMEITNTSATVNHLAKLNTSGAAIIPLTTDTDGMVGIVIGTGGSVAQIAIDGQASCAFDGATTAGDFVTVSSSVQGDCTDYGSSRPGGQSVGRVLSTNSSAGTYTVALGLSAPGGGVPNGTIAAFASLTCPSGWTEYTASRGLFLRGYDNSAGIDPSGNRAVANVQQDALQEMTGSLSAAGAVAWQPIGSGAGVFYLSGGTAGVPASQGATQEQTTLNFDAAQVARTSTETRPKNIVVMYCQYTGGSPIIGATATGGATNYVARWTSGTVIGTGILYDNGSAVGIGTTSTGSLLNVNGGVSIGTSYVGTAAPTNGAIIQGNVGIGTTNPAQRLDLGGGNIAMGYEQDTNTCSGGANTSCSVGCTSGKQVLGGGCGVNSVSGGTVWLQNNGGGTGGWSCYYGGTYTAISMTVYAYCANIR